MDEFEPPSRSRPEYALAGHLLLSMSGHVFLVNRIFFLTSQKLR
jgi:hypothetical protein